MHQERRQSPRYSVTCSLTGRSLNAIGRGEVASFSGDQHIHGDVPDIGVGGLCLLTDNSAEVSDPFVCEILVPHVPVAIPTLLQVRWTCRNREGHSYRLGLQFVV